MKKRVWLLLIFAVAMGYLEASVVVYLRRIFYPEGFDFPLKIISLEVGFIEIAREVATIVMLLSVAFIAERTRRARFACFMLIFGVWDIAYYVWLWAAIGWPPSVLTWDLLFLIPVIWTGPVIAPVLVAVLLIVTSALYYIRRDAAERVSISNLEWLVAIAAAGVMFASFALNHATAYRGGVPSRFPWEVYAGGMVTAIAVLARIARRFTW